MTDHIEEPLVQFQTWYARVQQTGALPDAATLATPQQSQYSQLKAAYYAAWHERGQHDARMVSPEGLTEITEEPFRAPVSPFQLKPRLNPGMGYRGYPAGPPPVTRIERYDFIAGGGFEGASEPGLYTPTDKQPALRDQYPPTTTMERLPDDTNPGFPVIAFDPEPGHEG